MPEKFPSPINGTPVSSAPSLEDLLKQYGKLSDIPDEFLDNLGYERVEGGRISKKSYIETIKEREANKQARIERKSERIPFEEITVLATETSLGRRLAIEDTNYIHDKIVFAGFSSDEVIADVYGEGAPLITLIEEVTQVKLPHMDEETSNIPELRKSLKDFLMDPIYNTVDGSCDELNDEYIRIFDECWDLHKEEHLDYKELTSAGAFELHSKLERLRGQFADPDKYHESFEELLMDEFEEESPYKNRFEAGKLAVAEVLKKYGLHDQAEILQNAKNLVEITSTLKASVPYSRDEIKLREQIRSASIKEKIEISGKLKELKNQREYQQRLLGAVVSYYSAPEAIAKYVNSQIKKAQNRMIFESKDSADKVNTIYINALPDITLDADPGNISGDCTEGKPLPFDDPEIPLHNLKVFDKNREHIGNIYLLETSLGDETKVWHLEAIQIPCTFDWKFFVKNLFKRLAEQATGKGISGITTNDSNEKISNYDYISRAVIEYAGEIGAAEGHVEIPEVNRIGKSEFQSEGGVLIFSVDKILNSN